jgi:catechol 2,3-dioxygenase-like lactoylglutathione lyase family enzyme
MYGVRYTKPPQLPHKSEYAEVMQATEEGIPIEKGLRASDMGGEETHDVGGVLLARPFKIARIGPVRLFVEDMEQMVRFYRDDLGLTITEEVNYKSHHCVFLRANTEHHTMALYPLALREELHLRRDTTLMSFGVQLGTEATGRRVPERKRRHHQIPAAELFPGIDYCAFAIDPDGFAFSCITVEQIGWDGKPRPGSAPGNRQPGFGKSRTTRSWENSLGPLG